ncbi:hypothetical protein DFJ74DRAFT_132284 [Hyaloraphidium curvatum]|nr:hypothetical protein DFJ74DRAFT_132284 [Hyaloraphidium curvatum]
MEMALHVTKTDCLPRLEVVAGSGRAAPCTFERPCAVRDRAEIRDALEAFAEDLISLDVLEACRCGTRPRHLARRRFTVSDGKRGRLASGHVSGHCGAPACFYEAVKDVLEAEDESHRLKAGGAPPAIALRLVLRVRRRMPPEEGGEEPEDAITTLASCEVNLYRGYWTTEAGMSSICTEISGRANEPLFLHSGRAVPPQVYHLRWPVCGSAVHPGRGHGF